MAARPKLAVFKFASCDGCQLTLLNCENELLAVASAVEIAYFLEARTQQLDGPYDIGLVEGSVTTAHDIQRIKEARKQCRYLIALGACATAGGIQALRNWADVAEFTRCVYAHPEYIETLATSTSIADHVVVDFELRGCPISHQQLLDVVSSLLRGKKPAVASYSVCMECKRRQTVCVSVARGMPCLGPATQAGCGAICPAFARACFGCYGPKEQANPMSLMRFYFDRGIGRGTLVRLARNFNGNAPEFRDASNVLSSQ
jgi:coenzyme F420-reducing hydrogenase gamma subunit